MNRLKSVFAPAAMLAMLFIFIEILSYLGVIRNFILPAPSAVISALIKNFAEMLPHLIETLWVSALGLTLSILSAIVIAITMDSIPVVKKTLYPLIIASQTIPIMVITPVVILLMGFGLAPRLLVVVLVCFFPIVISMFEGLQGTDPDMIMLMNSMHATRRQTLYHVKLPSSMPALFSGIQISATYCVMAAVIAEWQGANSGLGVYMMRVRKSFAYDRMFASIILIIAASLLFFLAVYILQKHILAWKRVK